MICAQCHDYIPEDSLFCPHCGEKVTAPTRPWFWIVAVSVFALMLLSLVAY
jgi:RNA polymerase subunit RPABC4/transcription elongation factor Spt4